MRSISSFVCQECGYESAQWLGKCPECGTWNSLKEFQTSARFKVQGSKLPGQTLIRDLKPKKLAEITTSIKERVFTGFSEMDGVLGGGIITGSVILLAGDPGIGKSTLLLQAALNIAGRLSHVANDARRVAEIGNKNFLGSQMEVVKNSHKHFGHSATSENFVASPQQVVLYVSGEESEEQIKLRAERLIDSSKNKNLLLLSLNNTDAAAEIIQEIKPSLVIIDSIQTMESENLEGLAGSVAQVRYAAFSFIKVAKTLNIPIVLVGHVTKEGMVAGPMILSHMVDVVLFLEGEKTTGTRILRGLKNRFGPIDEVGIFVLSSKGMQEVKNPQHFFLTEKAKKVPGSILVVTIEGTRAFLVELQALVVFSKLPMPRRVAIGIDSRRLELLLAVLQKHCRLPFESMDVFVNVAGGLKLSDTACDLGICLALFSSLKNIPLGNSVAISEIGLLGELRPVPFLDRRIKEAKKLGFRSIMSANTHRYINEVINSLK